MANIKRLLLAGIILLSVAVPQRSHAFLDGWSTRKKVFAGLGAGVVLGIVAAIATVVIERNKLAQQAEELHDLVEEYISKFNMVYADALSNYSSALAHKKSVTESDLLQFMEDVYDSDLYKLICDYDWLTSARKRLLKYIDYAFKKHNDELFMQAIRSRNAIGVIQRQYIDFVAFLRKHQDFFVCYQDVAQFEQNYESFLTVMELHNSRAEKKKKLKEIASAEQSESTYPYVLFVQDLKDLKKIRRCNSDKYPMVNKRADRLQALIKEAIQMLVSDSEYKQQLKDKKKQERIEQEKKREREHVKREKEQLKEFKKLNNQVRDLRWEVRRLRRGQR